MARPKITRPTILAKALELVDAEGLEALSMRRLGTACGVEAMSLYNHVADKAEVLDGIVDDLYATVALPASTADPVADLEALARAWRQAWKRHPRALPLVATRPVQGPQGLRFAEAVLEALARAGIRGLEALYGLSSLAAFLVGHALLDVGEPAGEAPGAPEAPSIPSIPENLPHLTELGPLYRHRDPEEEFLRGLRALVLGLNQPPASLQERVGVGDAEFPE